VTSNNHQPLAKSPDFIGIGAIKSGTTWLHACLAEHPEIHTPNTKEIDYFSERFELGEDWYRGLFANPRNLLAGESTPKYLHNPVCAERIHVAAPDTKLIACLRNPVDRAFSHFMMAHRESKQTPQEKIQAFDELIRETNIKYVQYGLYAIQLKPYVDLFGINNIHIVLFDDINENPDRVISDVYTFLGINSKYIPSALHQKINPAARYRNAAAFSSLRNVIQYMEKTIFSRLIIWLKTNGVRDKVLNWWRIPQANIEMLPASREFLRNHYAKPNSALSELVGRNLSHW
jgi:hypothetical protein